MGALAHAKAHRDRHVQVTFPFLVSALLAGLILTAPGARFFSIMSKLKLLRRSSEGETVSLRTLIYRGMFVVTALQASTLIRVKLVVAVTRGVTLFLLVRVV